jgi:cyclomaltodextrinase
MRVLLVILAAVCVPILSRAGDVVDAPNWAAEAVFYQIFPERFCNGDPHNDPTRDSLERPIKPGPSWRLSSWTADWYSRDDWEKELGPNFYSDGVLERRYGGDLQGVINKLDYLSDLGINTIYFNPLFYSESLHKYDGNSYHHIDPNFGPDPQGDLKMIERETEDPKTWKWTAADKLFLDLLKQCHARGIRVIIDGVFNHTGRDFFAFKDIRKNQAKSHYKDWYAITSFDDPQTKRNEFSYKGWWGHMTLPIFAASANGQDMHPGPKAYIFAATKRWMQPRGKRADGIDGWRLDVAEERPTKFWADWNALVRQLNPDAYTTAEIWKSAAEFVKNDGFSACMNYNAFAIPVKGFLIDNKIPASKFAQLLDERRTAFPPATAAVMQNLVDSHDVDRVASMIVNGEGTKYSTDMEFDFNQHNNAASSQTYDLRKPNERERNIQRLIVLLQMTYLGAPMIYYGDEVGMWGGGDPDCRMPMVWPDRQYDPQVGDPRSHERKPDEVKFDRELFDFYKQAIALHRQHHALNHGEISFLAADDTQRAIVFSRKSTKETLLVALNRGDKDARINVNISSDNLTPIFVTRGEIESVKTEAAANGLDLILPSLTGAVFRVD